MAAEGGLFITIVMIMMIIVLIIITGIMTIMTISIMIWLFLLKMKTALIPNHGDSASERRKPGSQVEQLWLFFLSCITE